MRNDSIRSILSIDEVSNNEDKLTEVEAVTRLELIHRMVDKGGILLPQDVCDIDTTILQSLIDKGMVVGDDRGLRFIYPVSGEPTHHRVHLADGREFTSMCAIDALGSAFTFWQDLEIYSKCSYSAEEIYIRIENTEIVETNIPEIYAIHLNLEMFDNWAASC